MSSIDPSLSAGMASNPELKKQFGFEVGSASIAKNHPNEDALVISRELGLFGVLDGAGGHAGGEIASSTGAAALKEIFQNNPNTNLGAALQQASDEISAKTEGATTAAVVKVIHSDPIRKEATVEIASVGDARVYVVDKNGEIRLITIDNMPATSTDPSRLTAEEQQKKLAEIHSQDQLDQQTERTEPDSQDQLDQQTELTEPDSQDQLDQQTELTEPDSQDETVNQSAQLRNAFMKRNVITEWLGSGRAQNPLVYPTAIEAGEVILITSDGVHDNLTDSEICELASSTGSTQDLARQLAEQATARAQQGKEKHVRAKPDDTSVIVLRYAEISSPGYNLKDFLLDSTEQSSGLQRPEQIEAASESTEQIKAQAFYEGSLPKNKTVAFDIDTIPFPIRIDLSGFELELKLRGKEGQPDKLVVAVPSLAETHYRSGKYQVELAPGSLYEPTMLGREQSIEKQLGIHLPKITSREHLQLGFDGRVITFKDLSRNGTTIRPS